jgi:hypothetical protein
MNEIEVKKLFLIINETYSNFSISDVKITIWADLLREVPFDRAQRNLRSYVMDSNNKFPPHPGELAKSHLQEAQGRYVPDAAETRALIEAQKQDASGVMMLPQCAIDMKERLKQLAGSQHYFS